MFDDLDDPMPLTADELMLSSVHLRAAHIRRARRARIAGVAGAAVVVAGVVGLFAAGRGSSSRKVETATTAPVPTTTTPSGSTTTPSPTTAHRGGGPATSTATTTAPSAALLPGTKPPVPFSSVQLTLTVQPARFRWSEEPAATLTIRNRGTSTFTFTPWATCRTELSFTTAAGKVTGYPLPKCLGLDGPVTIAPGQVVRITKPLTELVPQLARSASAPAPAGYAVDVAMFDTSLSGQKLRSPAVFITVDADAAASTTTAASSTTTGVGSTTTTAVTSTSTGAATAPST